jgi:hypothetical protein
MTYPSRSRAPGRRTHVHPGPGLDDGRPYQRSFLYTLDRRQQVQTPGHFGGDEPDRRRLRPRRPRVDNAAGLTIDDGWYLLFAQAIARGDGFTLTSSPIPGLLPTYPPAWPALMSLVFLWAPHVPANVPLLKLLSIAALLAIVPIGWRYFQQRGMPSTMAAGVTLAVVMTPAFVFLATSTLMSECVFTLAMLAGTFMADRSMIDSPTTLSTRAAHPADATRATITTIAAGALAAAAVLIRSAGLPLPIAIGVLFVWRRRWRQALLFAATCALCLAPWWW